MFLLEPFNLMLFDVSIHQGDSSGRHGANPPGAEIQKQCPFAFSTWLFCPRNSSLRFRVIKAWAGLPFHSQQQGDGMFDMCCPMLPGFCQCLSAALLFSDFGFAPMISLHKWMVDN